VPGTSHHVRRVRCEGPPPGDLDPTKRERGPGASALAGGTPRLPPGAVACTGLAAGPGGYDARVSRNVLVVTTVEHAESVLRQRLGPDLDEVRIVVPVVQQGFLDWLANDERAASDAEDEASRLAAALPHVADARKGEADVVLAIRDALATFGADEIVVALHPQDEAPFVERVAQSDLRPSVDGVPVRTIVIRDPV
jgi:hypothetical protein